MTRLTSLSVRLRDTLATLAVSAPERGHRAAADANIRSAGRPDTVQRVIRWRRGTVTGVRRSWRGAVELDVEVRVRRAEDPPTVRALAYPRLVGEPAVGDTVLLNLGALALGLGTGGYAL